MATLIPTDHPLFWSEARVQASGHAVETCSAATGHTVRAVAFCDTPRTASALVAAVEAARAPIEANLAGYDAQKVTDEIHQLMRDGRGVQGTVYAALREAYSAGRAARPWASHLDQTSPMTVGPEEYFEEPSPPAAPADRLREVVEALEAAHPHLETLHSVTGGEGRKIVWAVIKRVRAALVSLRSEREG